MNVPSSSTLRLLVICNAYPSNSDLYRNGFIHRRVKEYQKKGAKVEVFYNHQPVKSAYEYEYDGVAVTVGNDAALYEKVTNTDFDSFLVHFAEPSRIDPLLRAEVRGPIFVWIHGFEAEAWHRRWFNFIQSQQQIREALQKKREYYEHQNEFLGSLVRERPLDMTFINVSDWFKTMIVEPDLDVEFENDYVIPNLIDDRIFPYREKSETDRLNILSIRPFASYKYANDQTVEAIKILSARPYFNELNFTIVGDGRLFSELTEPLAKYRNVKLRKRFLGQEEISKLHAENGVFLAPTRFDSQGVSMCEAMSSGLVPISTDIAAIPEFVSDGESGLLVPPESPLALADAIEELYFDSELFSRLSVAAASSIRALCGREATTSRELDLICEKAVSHGA